MLVDYNQLLILGGVSQVCYVYLGSMVVWIFGKPRNLESIKIYDAIYLAYKESKRYRYEDR